MRIPTATGKIFLPMHQESDGLWYRDMQNVRRILFCLPELLASGPDTPILLCEGEKDVISGQVSGFVCTTNPGGSGAWRKLVEDEGHLPLKNRIVWVVPDADAASEEWVKTIGETIGSVVKDLRILRLPNSNEVKGYDLSDFIADVGQEHAAKSIRELAEEAPVYVSEAPKEEKLEPKKTAFPSLISFSDLTALDIPEPQMLVPGLIGPGLGILAGPPKVCKSWWAMQLSIAVATGEPFLEAFATDQGAVLHLGLEDNRRRFRSRLLKQLDGAPAPGMASFTDKWPLISHDETKNPGGLSLIHRWLEDHHDTAKLVVIDTLQKIRQRRGRNGDAYEGDYAALEGLQRLAAQYSVSIIVVHHLNKTQGHTDEFNRVSGTSGITGCADQVMILTRSRGAQEGKFFTSGRDVEDRRGIMTFDPDFAKWSWTGEEAEMRLSAERTEILEILRTSGAPMTPKEIAELTEPKKTTGAVQRNLSRMVDAGLVDRAVGQAGRYITRPGIEPAQTYNDFL